MSDERLQTVAQFHTEGEAKLAEACLKDAGIPCMLTNENQAGVPMMFDASRGAIDLKVPASRAAEAQARLADDKD